MAPTAAQAFRNGFTDRDIIDFLVNVECLEGQFDTYGAFGHGFFNNLSMGGVCTLRDAPVRMALPEALLLTAIAGFDYELHVLLLI